MKKLVMAAMVVLANLAAGCSMLGLDLSQFMAKPPVEVSGRLVAPEGCEQIADGGRSVCREAGWEIVFDRLDQAVEGVGFTIRNTGDEPLAVVWDESAYVGPDGQASLVMHTGIRFMEKESVQSPSVIPPGARLTEVATPTENVRFISGQYGGWTVSPLFAYLVADKLNGKTVGLYLTIRVAERKTARTYRWEISARQIAPAEPSPAPGGVTPSNLAPTEP